MASRSSRYFFVVMACVAFVLAGVLYLAGLSVKHHEPSMTSTDRDERSIPEAGFSRIEEGQPLQESQRSVRVDELLSTPVGQKKTPDRVPGPSPEGVGSPSSDLPSSAGTEPSESDGHRGHGDGPRSDSGKNVGCMGRYFD